MWKQSRRNLRQLLHTHSNTDLRQQHTRAWVLALTSKTGVMDVTLHRHVCPVVEDVFSGFGSFFSPSWSEEAEHYLLITQPSRQNKFTQKQHFTSSLNRQNTVISVNVWTSDRPTHRPADIIIFAFFIGIGRCGLLRSGPIWHYLQAALCCWRRCKKWPSRKPIQCGSISQSTVLPHLF